MIRFPCPKCRVVLEVEKAAVVRCPACGQMCRLPETPQEPDRPRSSVRRRNDSTFRPGEDPSPPPKSSLRRKDEEESLPPPPRSSRKRRAAEKETWQEDPPPQVDGASNAWLIPLILMLGLVGFVTGIATLVLFVLHDGGVTGIALGGLMAVVGWMWVVGRAAEDGELLACLLIPGYSLLYTVRNLETVGMACFVQIVGLVLLGASVAVYENPDLLPEQARTSYASGPPEVKDPLPLPPPRNKEEKGVVANSTAEPVVPANVKTRPLEKGEPVALSSLNGLLAGWSFDEGEGSVAHDVAGLGLNATLVGCRWVKGVRGNAIEMNGKGDYFDYGRSLRFNFHAEGAFTVTAWFKTRASRGDLVAQRSKDDSAPVIHVWIAGGTLHGLVRQDGNELGEHAEVHGDTVNDGEWHHFALTRDERGEVELFLDGKSQSKKSAPDSRGSITTDVRVVGTDYSRAKRGWDRFFAGSIDELGIFDRALELKEIHDLTGQ